MTELKNPEAQVRLGKKLRKIREEHNLTQEDVAKAADISAGYYARVERGKHNPSALKLIKICKVLKVDPSDILP